MEGLALLAAIDGAITIIERLEPEVEKMVQKGEIKIEEQQARHDRLDALRDARGAYYSGPEMKLSTDGPTGPMGTPVTP